MMMMTTVVGMVARPRTERIWGGSGGRLRFWPLQNVIHFEPKLSLQTDLAPMTNQVAFRTDFLLTPPPWIGRLGRETEPSPEFDTRRQVTVMRTQQIDNP